MAKRNPNDSVQITSVNQCLQEFDLLKEALLLEETEDTWQNIDSSLKRFTSAILGGACDYPDEFLKRWKETEIVRGLISAMSTERTRLSGTALDLVGATSRLGNHWDSAVPFYVPTIIKLLGRASKIYVTRATNTLTSLVKVTKSLGFIPYLIDGISDKSLTIRIGCADALLCLLSEATIDTGSSNSGKSTGRDFPSKRLNDIENAIKIGGRDRDPKVRSIIKRIWELYEQQWPSRAANLVQPFTPTIKRYLGISQSSALASSTHNVPVASGRLHSSQPQNHSIASHDTNHSQQKSLLKGHQRTSSKNVAEGNLPPPAKNTHHNSSKSNHAPLSKSSDLATLHKAMMIPLPRDESEPYEPSVACGPARVRVLSARTRTAPEGSIHQTQQSGSIMKRSNSTMRAQRVPLSSHADLPAGSVNGSTRAPTRVPLQSIQSTARPGKDMPPKLHMNPSTSDSPEPSKQFTSHTSNNTAKTSFKPTRVVSNTTQAVPKPASQSHSTLQTRPLPRRLAQDAPSDKMTAAPSVNNVLKVSVPSNTHSRKAPVEQDLPIIKTTRKAFKPTKPSRKVSSDAEPSTSKPSTAKTIADSNPVPTAPGRSRDVPSQTLQTPVALHELPEELRLPALIPLPCSPSPPPVSLPSSTLPSNILPSSMPAPVSDPPLEPFPTIQPLSTPTLLQSSAPIPYQRVLKADQNVSAIITPCTTSVNLKSSNPIEVISQSFKPQLRSLSSSLPSFGTPGPKICRSLPDDLIVPMSVPLPPSPNSPFPQLNLRTRPTPRINRRTPRAKSCMNHPSPRTGPKVNSSGLSTAMNSSNVLGETNSKHKEKDLSSTKAYAVANSDDELDENIAQQHIAQEGVLVDFDHEDTVWIPRPPALHDDLLQLNSALVATEVREENDDGEDGPQEKRRRLGAEQQVHEEPPSSNNVVEPKTVSSHSPKQHFNCRPLRRDPSMFHWDLPALENTNPDDSGDKTISCLKEQPLFLASDITINESASFHTSFIGNIDAQNQSTPVSGITSQGFHRLAIANLSP